MTIRAIHHVQITIPPGAQSERIAREFYCALLGLEEIEKPESLGARGGFWLRVGDRELHIGVEDGVDRRATKAHVAFEVDDSGFWRQRLDEAGIETIDSTPIPGATRFECRDPFGNRVEILACIPLREPI